MVLWVGVVDVICDFVFIGVIFEVNGFVEKDVIFCSKVVFIKCVDGEFSDEKEILVNWLMLCVDGVLLVKESKYIMLYVLKVYLE